MAEGGKNGIRDKRKPFKNWGLALSIALLVSVVALHVDIRGVEYYANELLLIECARRFPERFPLTVMRSHNHDNAVAARANQIEICQGPNGRRIDENDFKQFAAVTQKFLPARPREEFRRRRGNAAGRKNEQIFLIGRHNGFVGAHVAG